jgi:hypothetical protein
LSFFSDVSRFAGPLAAERGRLLAVLTAGAVAMLFLVPAAPAKASPDGTGIIDFHSEPAIVNSSLKSGIVNVTLNLTIQNTGATAANVTVTISEKGKTLVTKNVTVGAGGNCSIAMPWSIDGEGTHTVTASISGENVSAPAAMNASCKLHYAGAEYHPGPWYTIPCAFMVIIIPSVAIWLFIRHMRGGEDDRK